MLVEDDSVVSLLLQDNQNQQNQSNKKIWKTFLDQTLPSLAWQRMHNILLSAQDEHELSVQFLASKQTVQSMFPTAAGNKSPTESNSASSPNTSAIQSPSRKEEIRIGEEDLSQREEVASSSWCCFGSTAAVDPSSSRGKKTSIVTVQSRNAPASASIPYSPAKSTHSRGSDAYDEHDGDCVVVAFPSCSQPPADRSDLVMWYNAIMAVIYQQLDGHLHRSTTNGELKSTKIQIMDSNLNLSFKVMQSRPLPHIPAGHQNNPRQAMREFGESNSTLQPASVKKKEELMMISLDEDDGLQSKSIDIKPTTSTDPTAAEVSIFRPNQDNDLIFYLLDCHDMLGLVRCRNHTMMSHGLQSILQEVSQVGRWLLWCLQQHYIAVDASVLGGDSKTQASSNPSRNSNSRLIYCHDKEANRDIHKCVGEMYLESELQ